MEDHIYVADNLAQMHQVAHVPANKFHITRQVVGKAGRMNLIAQVVVNANFVPLSYEFVGGMRTNETGPASDQDSFHHYFVVAPFDSALFGTTANLNVLDSTTLG